VNEGIESISLNPDATIVAASQQSKRSHPARPAALSIERGQEEVGHDNHGRHPRVSA
jgi:hypothetical protein